MAEQKRLVVIGGVAGGATAASKARRCCPEAEVELYDQDEFISYAGCGLPYFLGGITPTWRKLIARQPQQFKSRQNINVSLRHRVNSIDPKNKTVSVTDLQGGREFERDYDTLIIATGAVPIMPDLPGKELKGVFVLRSLTDALQIKSFLDAEAPRVAVIVGAGSIGLEMCEAMRRLEMEVHLVELGNQVFPHLDADMARHIAEHLQENQVEMHLGAKVLALEGTGGAVSGVVTSEGNIEADMVMMCIGIRPCTDIVKEAGIELGPKDAIKVDQIMRTSQPDILACGDCVTTYNYLTGRDSWIPLGSTSRKQGRVAADTFAGEDSPFPGVQGTFISKIFEMTAGKTGISIAEARDAGFEAEDLTLEDSSLPGYYPGGGKMTARLTIEKRSGRLLGAQIVGDLAAGADKRLDVFGTSIKAGLTARDLSYLDLAYSPPYSHPMDLEIVAGNLAHERILGKTCACNSEGLENREQMPRPAG